MIKDAVEALQKGPTLYEARSLPFISPDCVEQRQYVLSSPDKVRQGGMVPQEKSTELKKLLTGVAFSFFATETKYCPVI